ncbi:MAG: ABC transporter permease [Polyangiaceae bacterium]|nr:ABC transporter permease [Polyangiaceae bacterium]
MHLLSTFLGATLLTLIGLPLFLVFASQGGGGIAAVALDSEVLQALSTSFAGAFLATLISLVMGGPLGYWLGQSDSRLRRWVGAFIRLPLVIPHPVAGMALLLLFSRGAFVGSALHDGLGVSIVNSFGGVILAMIFVSSPLLVLSVQDASASFDRRLIAVSENLGASPFFTQRHVVFPLLRGGLFTGASLCFARAISEFGAIAVLAYFPRTFPVLVWDRYSTAGLDAALPATAFLLLVTLILFAFLLRFSGAFKGGSGAQG